MIGSWLCRRGATGRTGSTDSIMAVRDRARGRSFCVGLRVLIGLCVVTMLGLENISFDACIGNCVY